MQQQQQYLWNTTTPPNVDFHATHTRSNNNNNHTTGSNNHSMHSSKSSSASSSHARIREVQRLNQIDDEMEHIQLHQQNEKELLRDTLQSLRQRIHDVEQDNWKYDIVK